MKIGSWIAESVSILKTSKNRYVFTADFLLFNYEVLFLSQENAILSFDVNAPQLKARSHQRADQPPLSPALEKGTDRQWAGLDRGERMLV